VALYERRPSRQGFWVTAGRQQNDQMAPAGSHPGFQTSRGGEACAPTHPDIAAGAPCCIVCWTVARISEGQVGREFAAGRPSPAERPASPATSAPKRPATRKCSCGRLAPPGRVRIIEFRTVGPTLGAETCAAACSRPSSGLAMVACSGWWSSACQVWLAVIAPRLYALFNLAIYALIPRPTLTPAGESPVSS